MLTRLTPLKSAILDAGQSSSNK